MQNVPAGEDLLDVEPNHVRAETGKRFLNYLIDVLVFYAVIFLVFFLIALSAPESVDGLLAEDDSFGLMERILALIGYAVYMSIMEAMFKGKSLGKLITGTRALNLDGSRISTATAFARGFSRAVPFCVFSAFGSPCDPWQDKWTNTMVVDERKSKVE